MTCKGCIYFERRGGTILPAEETCTALEDERMSARVAVLLTHVALLLARSGECPLRLKLPTPAGSYRAQDSLD